MSIEDNYRPFIRPRYSRQEYEEQLIRDLSAPQRSRVEPAHRIQVQRQNLRSANRESPSIIRAVQILHEPEFDSIRAQVLKLRERYIILYARYRAICQLCFEICEPQFVSADHIIPRRYNGSNEIHNLQLAHRECNGICCNHPSTCPHEVYKMNKTDTVIQFGRKPNTRSVYYFGDRLAA